MVIFRENTEDIYAGIEWEAESAEAKKVIAFLENEIEGSRRSASRRRAASASSPSRARAPSASCARRSSTPSTTSARA